MINKISVTLLLLLSVLTTITNQISSAQTPQPVPPAGGAASKGLDAVQAELETKTLKLKMPVGVSNSSFDLSDSARQAMISSPAMLAMSNNIQLTKQDSVTLRGLMDLPIASLSEVVSKQDYYTQLRFLRFGLLEIQSKPEAARLYAAKLYILTDEIFPRKAAMDSTVLAEAVEQTQKRANEQLKEQGAVASTPAQQPQEKAAGGSVIPLLLLLCAAGVGYYWFALRKKPEPAQHAPTVTTNEILDPVAITHDDADQQPDEDTGEQQQTVTENKVDQLNP